jgi:hypothetical protein
MGTGTAALWGMVAPWGTAGEQGDRARGCMQAVGRGGTGAGAAAGVPGADPVTASTPVPLDRDRDRVRCCCMRHALATQGSLHRVSPHGSKAMSVTGNGVRAGGRVGVGCGCECECGGSRGGGGGGGKGGL